MSKQKASDKRFVQLTEESLAKALKLSKSERIQQAEAKLAFAHKVRRSNKNNKETPLEQKAREKLENLRKDFEGEKKRAISKKRYKLQQEKKVLRMRQVLAKAFVPHLEAQIRQNWAKFTDDLPQCPTVTAKFLIQKKRKFG